MTKNRFHSLAAAAALAGVLLAGCSGKDDGAADSGAAPVNVSAGVPASVPSTAPPVVTDQIKGSQEAGSAMQSQAAKNGSDYNAARAKAQ